MHLVDAAIGAGIEQIGEVAFDTGHHGLGLRIAHADIVFKRDYHKQLYADKTGNLEQMNKFLQRYNLAKLNQEQIENMNRPITSTEIESVTPNSQHTEVQEY